jgi:hypothetical protein
MLPTHESLSMIEGSIHFLVKIFPVMDFMFWSGSQSRIVIWWFVIPKSHLTSSWQNLGDLSLERVFLKLILV